MKNIELKRKIYSLLYNNPILPIDDKKEIKVLIIADEETESVELFKAVLWAGQYPDTALKVTVCVKNSAAFIDKIKSEMPGIETFFSIDGVYDPSNPLAYVSICKKEQADKSLFDRVFDMVPNEVDMELQALTENINFAYALYENKRVSLKCANKNIYQKSTDTLEKSEKKLYNLLSSYASAVHTRVKLHYCESQITSEKGKEKILMKAINAGKSGLSDEFAKLYDTLVKLEHRRWMAYMVSIGWNRPEKDRMEYLYEDGNDHRNKEKKLHACLYPSAKETQNLTQRFNNIFLGNEQIEEINDLNDVSLFCYQTLCRKIKDMIPKVLTTDVSEKIRAHYPTFHHTFNQLLEDVDNSIVAFETEFDRIRANDIKLYEKIMPLSNLLKERNKKTNFYDIDAQLIDLTPFCLWYGKKYKNVITLTNGNSIDAIAVPLLLSTQKTFFIGEDKNGENEKIENFFKSYYGTSKSVRFKTLEKNNDDKLQAYRDCIEWALDQVNHGSAKNEKEIVVNVLPGSDPIAFIAAGEYSDLYPIVSYANAGIKCYNGMMNEYYKIGDRNLTADECMKLSDWSVTDQGKEVIPYDIYKELTDDKFWKLLDRELLEKKDGRYYYTKWQKMFECYERETIKGKKIDLKNESTVTLKEPYYPQDYTDKISGELKSFLNKLEELGIIGQFKDDIDDGKICGHFIVKNIDVYRCLDEKSGTLFENVIYYKCKFSGLFNYVRTGVKIEAKKVPSKVAEGTDKKQTTTNNEIDIIAIKGMKPIFISCKSTAELHKEIIYEIHSEATLLGGIPVIAVSQSITKDIAFVNRAKDWGVSLIDANIIEDDNKFNNAMKEILEGAIVSPLDEKWHKKEN